MRNAFNIMNKLALLFLITTTPVGCGEDDRKNSSAAKTDAGDCTHPTYTLSKLHSFFPPPMDLIGHNGKIIHFKASVEKHCGDIEHNETINALNDKLHAKGFKPGDPSLCPWNGEGNYLIKSSGDVRACLHTQYAIAKEDEGSIETHVYHGKNTAPDDKLFDSIVGPLYGTLKLIDITRNYGPAVICDDSPVCAGSMQQLYDYMGKLAEMGFSCTRNVCHKHVKGGKLLWRYGHYTPGHLMSWSFTREKSQ